MYCERTAYVEGLEDGREEFFETEEHGEVKTMEEDGIEDLGYL